MIQYVKGDIFQGEDDVIVHGCNCMNNMASGVAYQVAKYYPEAVYVDIKTVKGDPTKLGTYTSWTGQHRFHRDRAITIVNAYTQFLPVVSLKPFDYDAFATVLPKIKADFAGKTIATVRIGAGLAGGEWSRIEATINQVFNDQTIKVYVL